MTQVPANAKRLSRVAALLLLAALVHAVAGSPQLPDPGKAPYIQETIKVNDDRWAMIKDYAANHNAMIDQLAQDYMKRSAAIDRQLTDLRIKYVPIFQTVVSPKKTAQWYQIDRRLDLLINLQLAALIPVIDPNK